MSHVYANYTSHTLFAQHITKFHISAYREVFQVQGKYAK